MEVDLSIGNAQKSDLGRGTFYLYFLRDNPQRHANDFAKGLNGMFHGMAIEIKENNSRVQYKNVSYLPSLTFLLVR